MQGAERMRLFEGTISFFPHPAKLSARRDQYCVALTSRVDSLLNGRFIGRNFDYFRPANRTAMGEAEQSDNETDEKTPGAH